MTTSEEHERLLSNLGRIQSETGELRRKLEELKTKLDSVKSFEERELFDQSLSQLARHITSLNSTILNDDNGVLDSWVLSPEILDPENLALNQLTIFGEKIYNNKDLKEPVADEDLFEEVEVKSVKDMINHTVDESKALFQSTLKAKSRI